MLQLILRMYDPDEGEILIDDIPLKHYPLSVIRRDIGFVPQDPFLFSDTMAGNIGFGLDETTSEEVRESARMASLEDEILTFPSQYETMIGERGITLSGGQKQRTTLARAIIKKPSILILDDSFSSVDTYTEDRILRNLKEFREGRTCILVSHRVSTVQDSDWIFVLDEGRIVEEGTHVALMQEEGVYYDLYQKQLIEEELHIRRIG
jgi:ATP-binding cassette subfamily B protein